MAVKHLSAPYGLRLYSGHSARPALTRLAVLAAANPVVAASLLKNPVAAATSHPHYVIPLDAVDRAILVEIHSRARTVSEFLAGLAYAVDDNNNASMSEDEADKPA